VTKKTAPFVVVWQKAIRDADMPVGRKGFALLLSTWADADGTHCFPSIATLIKLGCAKPTVHRHLATLEADGWLDIRHGGGRRPDRSYAHNVYTLCLPGASGVSDETVPPEGARSPLTPLPDPTGSLVRRSGVPSETGTVSRETHDQPIATNPKDQEEREEDVDLRRLSGLGRNFGPGHAARSSWGAWLVRRDISWWRSALVKRQSKGFASWL
jgi:Helix-turn-helix domain